MNLLNITNILTRLLEKHKSIRGVSFVDIDEIQVFNELNIHCYISLENSLYEPLSDSTLYHFNVLLTNNSSKERTQLIQSINETHSIAQEILYQLNRWYMIEPTEIVPHIQRDEQLTIGSSFDIKFRVNNNNDACISPFGELFDLEDEYNL
jgi:hypothetical protein